MQKRRLRQAPPTPCRLIYFARWTLIGGGVDDKDASIFPMAVNDTTGQPALAMLHRPLFPGTRPEETARYPASRTADLHRESIWISYCPMDMDGREPHRLGQFTSHHRLASPVSSWERLKIGGGTPPVLTGMAG